MTRRVSMLLPGHPSRTSVRQYPGNDHNMKNTLLILAIGGATCTNAQLNVGLKAQWTFSGGTGDASGNGHDGTIVGTVTPATDRAGNAGCAFAFPGDSSRIDIPFHTDFDIAPAGEFTMSLWYQGGSPSGSDLEWIFRKRNFPGFYHSWNYGLSLYDVNRGLYFGGDDGQLWSSVIPVIPDPQWHNLVGIYSNGTHQLWLDNALVASDLSQSVFLTQSDQGISIGETFTGSIDDIRFYDRALSVNEVALLFAEASSCATVIQEPIAFAISITPNPASDVITIRASETLPMNMRALELTDATGRLVRRASMRASGGEVDVRELPNGLYFLRMGAGTGSIVKKVVKD